MGPFPGSLPDGLAVPRASSRKPSDLADADRDRRRIQVELSEPVALLLNKPIRGLRSGDQARLPRIREHRGPEATRAGPGDAEDDRVGRCCVRSGEPPVHSVAACAFPRTESMPGRSRGRSIKTNTFPESSAPRAGTARRVQSSRPDYGHGRSPRAGCVQPPPIRWPVDPAFRTTTLS